MSELGDFIDQSAENLALHAGLCIVETTGAPSQSGHHRMSRNSLIAIAAILVLTAGAVLAGAYYFNIGGFGAVTPESRLSERMEQISSEGGFAATFSDQDSRRWQIADGHRFERLAIDSSKVAVGRLTSSVPVDVTPPSWESQGLSIEIPVSLAQSANGKRLEIGIIAQSSKSNSSNVLTAVFATRQAGNSGWRNFKLTADMKVHTILFDMPFVDAGYTAKPIVVLHSDAQGKGRSVELLGVYVRLAQQPGS